MEGLFYFIIASFLLTIAPGPDILYLLSKSLANGARHGIVLAAGLCSGLIIHTALVAVGIAAIIKGSDLLFQGLKYIGALYLFYLAWQAYKGSGNLYLVEESGKNSFRKLYCQGILMNVLNPKVILFFLAFLPQFVHLNRGNAFAQICLLGAIFGLQAFVVFSSVAILAGKIRDHVLSIPKIGKRLELVQMIVLFCIGLGLLF